MTLCLMYFWLCIPSSLSTLMDAQQTSLQWHNGKDIVIFQTFLYMKGILWFEAMFSTQWIHKNFSDVFIFSLKTFFSPVACLGWFAGLRPMVRLFIVCQIKSLPLSGNLQRSHLEKNLEKLKSPLSRHWKTLWSKLKMNIIKLFCPS